MDSGPHLTTVALHSHLIALLTLSSSRPEACVPVGTEAVVQFIGQYPPHPNVALERDALF